MDSQALFHCSQSWTLCTLTVPGQACWPVLPVQLVLLCKLPLSTMTSTPYSLPGMRPTSRMRYSVLSLPRVVLSTRAERFHRSRWYLSQSPAGGTQVTRRDRGQPLAPACSSKTFWGTGEREREKAILKWGISGCNVLLVFYQVLLAKPLSQHSYCMSAWTS